MKIKQLIVLGIMWMIASAANAQCNYRPSHLFGGGKTGFAVGVVVGGTGVAKAASLYTLTHAGTGAAMLGSTAGGASAAGTVGIMGGTSGLVATAGAVLTGPVAIITGAAVGLGVLALEGGCYFADERITDRDEVLANLQEIETNFPGLFELWNDSQELRVRGADGYNSYQVENLYIVNGILKRDDWFWNTTIVDLNIYITPIGAAEQGDVDAQ